MAFANAVLMFVGSSRGAEFIGLIATQLRDCKALVR